MRHLDYYLALARRGESQLHGAEQLEWFDRFDVEQDNFRAALDWALKNGQMDKSLELAESLQFLGAVEFVEASRSTPGHFENVRNIMEQSLALWQTLGDKIGISWELNLLASVAQAEGDLTQSRALWEETVALRRVVGDRILLAYSLRRLAEIALQLGDYVAAEAGYREGHRLLMEAGGKAAIAASLASARGQLSEAAFNAAWDEGRALSMEQAIDYALSREEAPQCLSNLDT